MSSIIRTAAGAVVLASFALAGCAGEGGEGFFATGALSEPKVDPTCVSLSAKIDQLRKEGVAEKIEKAAAKKYKMTQADLGKADQLTKANADFQLQCAPVIPKSAAADPIPEPAPAPKAKAKAPKAAAAATADN